MTVTSDPLRPDNHELHAKAGADIICYRLVKINMEPYKEPSTFIVFFSALLCLLLSSVTTVAFSAVIDNIEIDDETSPAQLRINFKIPIQ